MSAREGVAYRLGDRDVIGFCSNDYLGLADRVPSADAPAGAAASRLICGDLADHRDVESQLARLTDQPDAVLFPSGFQLNVGVLPSVLSPEDTVFSDALNHASLIDGMRLSAVRPTILVHRQAPPAGPRPSGLSWWVTESVFSMDGDATDPEAFAQASDAGYQTYVDDAHGIGLYDGGQGWAGHHRLRPTLTVGTLSKAFGCAGAFVSGSTTACEWIRTRARSFVFSTGVSPRVVSAIRSSIDLIRGDEGDARRQRLWTNIAQLGELLRLDTPPGSPIFPVVIGDNRRAVAVAERLLHEGWHVQAIRPPTVPDGTARLRITVTAGHEPAQIEGLVSALRRAMGESPRVCTSARP